MANETPYLQPPPIKDDHRRNGLMCFRDRARECGPDCMAYSPAPEGPDYMDQQWANCRLLVDSFRSSKHLTILAGSIDQVVRLQKNEAADRQRTAVPHPAHTP